jgi:acetyltransferase-like isoleucine patch superfamily enzyme
MIVDFNGLSPAKMQRAGFALNFAETKNFLAEFAVEKPVVVQGTIIPDGPFRMGAFSASYGGRLYSIDIGRYCSFAPDLQTGWEEHPADWATSSMLGYVKDLHGWATLLGRPDHEPGQQFNAIRGLTTIGNDVWIGQGVFIRSGVTIGDGAIIGARSLVLRDVPPYAIVVGTPAKVIRFRFPEKHIESLLQLEWWRYSIFDMPGKLLRDVPRFVDYMHDAIASGRLKPYAPGWTTAEELAAIIAEP